MIDASSNTANYIKTIKSKSVTRVGRYYNKQDSSALPSKCLTAQEAITLCSSGFSLVVIYQQEQSSYTDFSEEKGLEAANYARACAIRVGQPEGSGVYFSVDFDATQDELEKYIVPFFQGIKAELTEFKIGAYGSGLVCNTLYDKDLIHFRWLSQSKGYSGTKEAINSKQYNISQQYPPGKLDSLLVDYDESIGSDTDIGAFKVTIYQVTVQKDSALRMHSEPSVNAGIVARLKNGTKVVELAAINPPPKEWSYVTNGLHQGYVCNEYLQLI